MEKPPLIYNKSETMRLDKKKDSNKTPVEPQDGLPSVVEVTNENSELHNDKLSSETSSQSAHSVEN